MLKRLDDGSQLEGDYFTEQSRDSFGKMYLQRIF